MQSLTGNRSIRSTICLATGLCGGYLTNRRGEVLARGRRRAWPVLRPDYPMRSSEAYSFTVRQPAALRPPRGTTYLSVFAHASTLLHPSYHNEAFLLFFSCIPITCEKLAFDSLATLYIIENVEAKIVRTSLFARSGYRFRPQQRKPRQLADNMGVGTHRRSPRCCRILNAFLD